MEVKDGKKPQVLAYATIDLPRDKVSNSLENSDSYLESKLVELLDKKLVGKLSGYYTSVSIPTANTFSRVVRLPIEVEKDLASTIDLEIEQYIPIPKNLLTVDYTITSRTNKNLEVLICATPKNIVNRVIDIVRSVQLEPVLIEPSMNSISRLLYKNEAGYLRTIVMDIGLTGTDIAVLDKIIKATSSIQTGGNTFTMSIARSMNIPVERAHQLKLLKGFNKSPEQKDITKALKPDMDIIINEIKKLLRYYEERLEGEPIEQIIITGVGSNVAGLGDYFTNALYLPVRLANPWQDVSFKHLPRPKRILISRYITVAGAAMVSPKEAISWLTFYRLITKSSFAPRFITRCCVAMLAYYLSSF